MMPTHHRYLQELCGYTVHTVCSGFHLLLSSVMGGVLSGFSLMLGIKLYVTAGDMLYSHVYIWNVLANGC